MSITASTIGTTYQVSTADYSTRYEARIYLKVNSQSIADNTSSVTVWWTMKKVDKHNNFAQRLPVVEEQIKVILGLFFLTTF